MSAPLPTTSSNRRPLVLAIIVVVLVVALVGGSVAALVMSERNGNGAPDPGAYGPSAGASATVPMPAVPEGLQDFYGQKLRWKNCSGGQCTRLRVPLDYAKPDGREITLAVLRVPATRPSQRVGQLLVNPGGPGGSGVQYAAAGAYMFGGAITRHFDLIGFDPRGVGLSTPLRCMSTKQTDEMVAADPDPDTPEEVQQLEELTKRFGQGCLDKSGELAAHMSTVEAAKDMDVLRAALGEHQLDYLGASYGTLLGATYAEQFPKNVRRMVLDGAIDPSLSNRDLSLEQAGGFEVALRAYVADCVKEGDCVLGDSVDEGTKRIRELLDQIDEKPLPTSDGRELTEGLAMLGVWMPLYLKEFWETLTSALEQAIDKGKGDRLLALADQYTSRGPKSYNDNSLEALYAVNCLDHGDSIPSSQVPEDFAAFEKVSPTFGRSFAYGLSTCASWPVQSGKATTAMAAEGAAPIVVIGTTRDPATPLRWAEALAGQLSSGVLITRDGDGHTGFQQGNRCVDRAVEKYLVRGIVPQDKLTC